MFNIIKLIYVALETRTSQTTPSAGRRVKPDLEAVWGWYPTNRARQNVDNTRALAPLSSMASVSVPVSVNEDQAKAMAKKVGTAALDAGKKAPCP